jgi:hypothetical protein
VRVDIGKAEPAPAGERAASGGLGCERVQAWILRSRAMVGKSELHSLGLGRDDLDALAAFLSMLSSD